MIGDKLVISEYHRAAAAKVMEKLKESVENQPDIVGVSVAGESGSGKSEIAHCLGELLEKLGKKCLILGQDDYFKLPPKSNHKKRLEDISWVGPSEVKLDLLDEHIEILKRRTGQPLTKPLVFFEEDRIDVEVVQIQDLHVVIAEGTYTTLLKNIDLRVFIDRNYRQTKKARLKRARDPDLGFIEKVLEIEHLEISKHKTRANVVIDPPQDEQ